MPSLKDLATLTSQLDGLTNELHSELTQGGIDFRKMVGLADDIGAIADRLASGFTNMADALEASLDDRRDGDS
jgi:DNA polymerase III delta prime subunit